MAYFDIKDEDLTSLRGKVAIVTGGSSGIGLATVTLLLSLGATVVNADIAPTAEPAGATATFIQTDVANWSQLNHLFKETKKLHGRVDHVFANAGLGPRADYLGTELDANGDLKEPSWDLLDVSLRGVINTVTLAIYHYRTQEPAGGSIVVCGSSMGIQRCRAVDYATAKHAVLGFARGLHPVLAATGLPIRLNTVAPSWTNTAVLPGLKATLDTVGVDVQPASAVAYATALLMADDARNGHAIHVQQGRFQEIDEAILLPAADKIRGPDYMAEDEVLKRALEVMAAQAAAAADGDGGGVTQ